MITDLFGITGILVEAINYHQGTRLTLLFLGFLQCFMPLVCNISFSSSTNTTIVRCEYGSN